MGRARHVVGVRRLVTLTAAARVEQDPGNSEDAPPLVLPVPDGVALGVFDGMGGAGASRHIDDEGRERTEAYLAARACHDAAKALLTDIGVRAEGIRGRLEETLADALAEVKERLGESESALRSSLIRRLPTTAALALVSPTPMGVTLTVIWAGDSRIYVLHPTSGLLQATRDDVKGSGDALTMITSDPPLTRCVSADGPIRLREHVVEADMAIVIAATDGCFAHLPSPWHFEHLVLSALLDSETPDALGIALGTSLRKRAFDDATLALAVTGFDDLGAAQQAFAPRLEFVSSHLTRPLDEQNARVHEAEHVLAGAQQKVNALAAARDEARNRLWARYRVDYEQVMPRIEDEEQANAEGG